MCINSTSVNNYIVGFFMT